MSDEGEKMCPLCAEEMDLTDQQLKPCKCGYEICVWCWHQIVEMAEKDETQGRCPACRAPYDKEKIVGMASKCERLVSEMNVEKKKSQRGKSKTSEGRKQLDSVRVIQRNLVYIVGLPFHLADEDVLQRREYFGQYGKVLKVSISRTSTGAIQHFPNNTCSVYITYSKEEEAIRCIQLVHGFVLDGRPLRACFGTTKYCHAWLRNVPCSNPDCLYLHEIGSQEDSFTKDEVISAYTRNQVHQITGATYSSQRRSGTSLPSPTDDNSDNSAASQGKPTSKPTINSHNLTGVRVPSPDSSSGRSAAPPIGASWGSRSSLTNTRVSGPPSQKPNMVDGLTSHSKPPISAMGKKVVNDEKTSISQHTNFPGISEPKIIGSKADATASLAGSSVSSAPLSHFTSSIQPAHSPSTVRLLNTTDADHSSSIEPLEDVIDERDGSIENVCSSILSMNIHVNQKPQNGYFEHIGKSSFGGTSENVVHTSAVRSPGVQSHFTPGLQTEESHVNLLRGGNHSLSLTNERDDYPAIAVDRVHDLYHTSSFSRHSTIPSPQVNNVDSSIFTKFDGNVVGRNKDLTVSASYFPNKNPEEILISQDSDDATYSKFSLGNGARSWLRKCEGEAKSCAPDMGESSIISSILASDFDPLNDPFVLPQNLGDRFGGEKKLYNVIGSRKVNNASQSRFAFARDEGLSNQVSDFGRSGDYAVKQDPFLSNHSNGNVIHVDRFVNQSSLTVAGGFESDILTNNHSHFTSSKIPVSKSQISAPPGFSVPSRLPPPGFPSLATEHKFESTSGSNLPVPRFSQSNYSQVSTSGNTYINGDVEFIDPAILAVGKGTLASGNNSLGIDMRTSFSPQFGYEDPRVQPVTNRSLPPFENHRFPDLQETISSFGDSYGNSPRVLQQKQSSNPSPFSYFSFSQSENVLPSNGPWTSRNEPWRDSNLTMPELLRPERLVSNDSYSGHEDFLRRIPSSDSQYNGIYRI